MTDAEVPGSPQDPRPFPSMVTGEVGERLARAFRRLRESGYDRRLAPTAHPDEERQAAYYAWDRGQWPPRDALAVERLTIPMPMRPTEES